MPDDPIDSDLPNCGLIPKILRLGKTRPGKRWPGLVGCQLEGSRFELQSQGASGLGATPSNLPAAAGGVRRARRARPVDPGPELRIEKKI
jgi:hypothetical protein